MPKPNGAKEKAKEINKVRNAWSVRGSAVVDFLPENGQAENDFNALQTWVSTNKYGDGREQVGAFLCMYMLGQKDSEGNNLYNIQDVITPGRLVAEKKALYSKLMSSKELADFDAIDTAFKNGIERSCSYARGAMGNGLIAGNISEIITPEAATVSHLAIIILNNNVKSSYEGENLIEGTPVHRLKKLGLDFESVSKSHGATLDMIDTTSQNLRYMVDYVENGINDTNFTFALANYIMFDSALKRSREHGSQDAIPSLTKREHIEKVKKGEYDRKIVEKVTDFSPLEYSLSIVEDYLHITDESDIDDLIKWGTIDDEVRDNFDGAMLQRKKDFVEAYKPYVDNMEDEVYRYGIGAMYLNGNLFKNLQYSADPYIDNKRTNGTVAPESYVAFGNVSINFDKTLERKNVLREAYLSDLDVADYHFDPIVEGENGANIPDINQARVDELVQFEYSFERLNPTWKSSSEWKNMGTALKKAISVSKNYRENYVDYQKEPKSADAKAKAKAALEELNSAMEMVQIAARKYVEHKVERVDFEQGDDFSRLQTAKRLENFGRNQTDYMTRKLANEVTNTLGEEADKHIESVKSDYKVITRLYDDFNSLYGETHFHSTELDELREKIVKLRVAQESIITKGKLDAADSRKYYGVTNDGDITEGTIDAVIEKAQKYIDHRITEGLSKDRYSKRVDVAMRIKNYLEAVKENAERTQSKRLENYKNVEERVKNHNAFVNKFVKTKSDLLGKCNESKDTGKIPDNDKEMVKESLYSLLTYQKYIDDSVYNKGKSEIVKLVQAGNFKGAIDLMKADINVKTFVDTHHDTVDAVSKYATKQGCKNAMRRINSWAEKRKTINECVNNAKKITDGKMDKELLAKYIACTIILNMTKEPKSNDKKQEIKTATLIEETQNSKELEAVINRYQGTEDFASKMEAMYSDYAALVVHTKETGKMPEDVNKYLDDFKANKIDIVKGGNEPAKDNKPQVDAKKPEEVKQIQEVVKIN